MSVGMPARQARLALHGFRHAPGALRLQLRLAAKLDRITKGAEPGDYWQTLKQHLINNQQRQPA